MTVSGGGRVKNILYQLFLRNVRNVPKILKGVVYQNHPHSFFCSDKSNFIAIEQLEVG